MIPYKLTQDAIHRALSFRYEPPEGLVINNRGHLVLRGPGDGIRVMVGDTIKHENGAYCAYQEEK